MTGKLSKEENEFQNECFFVFCFPIRKKQDLWLFFIYLLFFLVEFVVASKPTWSC